MGGGGGGGSQVVPFNMAALEPFMPSVFNGPYNAESAFQNEEMIANKYPWITPPSGQFAGAQPGQFANSANPNTPPNPFFGGIIPGVTGVTPAPPPNPPIPPSVPQAGMTSPGVVTGGGGPSGPVSKASILSVLTGR